MYSKYKEFECLHILYNQTICLYVWYTHMCVYMYAYIFLYLGPLLCPIHILELLLQTFIYYE